jgi:hypothetical protein
MTLDWPWAILTSACSRAGIWSNLVRSNASFSLTTSAMVVFNKKNQLKDLKLLLVHAQTLLRDVGVRSETFLVDQSPRNPTVVSS